jgi:hypothetical protein
MVDYDEWFLDEVEKGVAAAESRRSSSADPFRHEKGPQDHIQCLVVKLLVKQRDEKKNSVSTRGGVPGLRCRRSALPVE